VIAQGRWLRVTFISAVVAALSAALAPLSAYAIPPVGALILSVTDCKTGAPIVAGEAYFAVVGVQATAVAGIDNGLTGTIGLGKNEYNLTVTSPGHRELHRRLHGTGDFTTVRTLALCLHPVAGSPESLVTTAYPIDVTCSPASGQLCNPPFPTSLSSADILRVRFTASPANCSSITVDFFLDGFLVFTSDLLGPGDSTPALDFGPVIPGAHVLSLQATGDVGGCNTGTLAEWAGTLTTMVALPVGPSYREQCRNGGWATFTTLMFRNQGQCLRYASTAGAHF
jgi:hypothetical protein